MGRKRGKYLTMNVHHHGVLWWLLIGWWWRPIKYFFMGVICGIIGYGLVKHFVD